MGAKVADVMISESVARMAFMASILAVRVVPMPEWPGGALRLVATAKVANSWLKP